MLERIALNLPAPHGQPAMTADDIAAREACSGFPARYSDFFAQAGAGLAAADCQGLGTHATLVEKKQ
jgi:hypothetical protein